MAQQEHVQQNNSTTYRNQILMFTLSKNNYESKKISACINHHASLLYLLTCRQPLSLKEILDELGSSKAKLLRDLKQLIKYELVIRVNFEAHVLYVINGKYNTIIHSVLSS